MEQISGFIIDPAVSGSWASRSVTVAASAAGRAAISRSRSGSGSLLEQVGLLVGGHGGDQVGGALDVQGLDQQPLHLGRQLGQGARGGGHVEGLEDGRPLEAVEFLHDLGQFGRVETGELGLGHVQAQVVGE